MSSKKKEYRMSGQFIWIYHTNTELTVGIYETYREVRERLHLTNRQISQMLHGIPCKGLLAEYVSI